MERAEYLESTLSKNRSNIYNLYKSIVLNLLAGMNKGKLTVIMPDKKVRVFGNDTSSVSASIKIHSNTFFKKIVLFGDVGFGESYIDGDWDTDSITDVISWMILNVENNPAISGSQTKFSPVSLLKIVNKYYHKFKFNSKNGSRRNISAHYDLNNDFFSLWLDESMTYSSGIFANDSNSLYEAQVEKYDRICKKLNLKSEDNVLEIGSGWGGFALHAAENYGCRVTTTTISQNQYEYVKNLVIQKGLDNRIKVLKEDYRNLTGKYDKIISIEMLEAVGHKYLPVYFKKVNELLEKNGAIALQVITSHDSNYEKLKNGVDWIQKHIFPGSLLPSISILNKTINRTSNLHLHDLKNFGLDYSRTLKIWRENFNNKSKEVATLGFDNAFRRKWNYYLSYCEAAFKMRNISVLHLVYTRPNNRNL